jgi:8-oxo-dGTP pyrophosphatase MutT (NUDIX family)
MQTSHGIICIRFTGKEYEFLMVKRRTSYAFTNFVLGKYNTKSEVRKYLSEMTVEEKSLIIYGNFDVLYYTAFMVSKLEIKDIGLLHFYEKCKKKFESFYSQSLIKSLCIGTSSISHTWDFPKGRPDVEESSLQVAVREFEEETSYNSTNYKLFDKKDPLILEFKTDANYKYILYFAYTDKIISSSFRVSNEISEIAWFSANKAKYFLRPEFKPYIKKIINSAKKLKKELV